MANKELIVIAAIVCIGKLINLHLIHKNIIKSYKDPHIWLHWNNKNPWKTKTGGGIKIIGLIANHGKMINLGIYKHKSTSHIHYLKLYKDFSNLC
jgi:hypothetical protein